MAENLWGTNSGMIRDRTTFDEAFKEYFLDGGTTEMKDVEQTRDRVWKETYRKYGQNGKRLVDARLFEMGGGKNLKQDRRTKAKKVVVSPREYVRLGSKRVDLAGYDTPKDFVFIGRQGNRTRYARVINTKNGIRFIDKRGRYVGVKTK